MWISFHLLIYQKTAWADAVLGKVTKRVVAKDLTPEHIILIYHEKEKQRRNSYF